MLRHADGYAATVWAEVDRPCEVRVRVGDRTTTARTFAVHGHHYAVVDVEAPADGSPAPYVLYLDGRQAWPEPGSPLPVPRVRSQRGQVVRLVVGSCRKVAPHDADHNRRLGVDALRAYAHRMMTTPAGEWPDLLLLIGDQVYADDPGSDVRDFLASRRDLAAPGSPGAEMADFEEYAFLYRSAWSDPSVRWLLSTVPSAMLFDDHDIRDDWNTSQAWRDEMERLPWWPGRITAGLGAYWIYQHLGNLSPAERADDPMCTALRDADGDAGTLLDEFARGVDRDPESYRWSFQRDIGEVRLLALDTRCGRVLRPHGRAILDPAEWAWFDHRATGGPAHILVASSLPYLLPPAVHHAERWNEAVCDGAWGHRAAAAAERLRQGIDLEHWAAFRRSFDAMAVLAAEVAAGKRGDAPASVLFLSGDVHYSYLARVLDGGRAAAPIYQAVCSPLRNPLPASLRWANRLACTSGASAVGRAVARSTAPPAPLRWRIEEGPWFRNALLTVDLDGRDGTLRWEAAGEDEAGRPRLYPLGTARIP